MTWVKVCGLSTPPDVAAAVAAGADAIGLVLAPSVRQIDVSTARSLVALSSVMAVLVTVDATPDEVVALAASTGASGVQPHGKFSQQAAAAASGKGLFVLQPVSVGGTRPDLSQIPLSHVPLLDTHAAELRGGTGRQFDWSLIPTGERRFVLAGGLSSENVAEAISTARPWGVDASSGLESSPGIKDPERIRLFVEGAKA